MCPRPGIATKLSKSCMQYWHGHHQRPVRILSTLHCSKLKSMAPSHVSARHCLWGFMPMGRANSRRSACGASSVCGSKRRRVREKPSNAHGWNGTGPPCQFAVILRMFRIALGFIILAHLHLLSSMPTTHTHSSLRTFRSRTSHHHRHASTLLSAKAAPPRGYPRPPKHAIPWLVLNDLPGLTARRMG